MSGGLQILKRWETRMRAIGSIAAVVLTCTTVAHAQTPSAIVESVNGRVTGAEAMDYVAPGQVIKLGASASIVISYLASCLRETISGSGAVTVGAEQSVSSEPEIKREKQMCDGQQAQLRNSDAKAAAGTVFRNKPRASAGPARVTIFSLSPLFDVPETGTLLIERMDKPEERREVALGAKPLLKGRFYDSASASLQLRPGGLYSATIGRRKVVFKVDQLATPSGTLLERLVRF